MRTLNVLILIVICSTLWSCSNKNFFEFDEIEHFKKNISEDELMEIYESQKKSEEKLQILEIVEKDYPETVVDNFDKLLIQNGYKKTNIDKNKYQEINEIFSENSCLMGSASACIPIYRDILIFKKNRKTIGIAKICFDCQMFHIVGTKKDLSDFGQCGDFKELKNILK